MFKTIRRMYELSKKDPEVLKVYESLTPEDIKDIPDRGNGKAVFIDDGTEEDFIEQERKDKGLSGWYERIKKL